MEHPGRLGLLMLVAGSWACTAPTPGPEGDEEVTAASDEVFGGSLDTTHQAVVAWLNGGKCTATIVAVQGNQGYALTAAHCVPGGGNLGNLRQGNNHANGSYDVQYPVVEAVVHPEYNVASAYDFAMVRFTGATGSTPIIAALASSQDNIGNGTQLDIVGYGQTENGNTTLRHHVVKPTSNTSEVSLYFNQPTSGMCFGDSGGGIIQNIAGTDYVVGVNQAVENNDCTGTSIAGRVSAVKSTFIDPFINGQPFQDQTCDQCTDAHTQGGGLCLDDVLACFSNTFCDQYVQCRSGCTTLPCVVGCDQSYPGGKQLYDQIIGCMCTSCSSECNGDSLCAPPPACYLDVVNDTCQSCYEGACCAEATACAGDAGCLDCTLSLLPADSCGQNQAYVDFATCTTNNCDGSCFYDPMPGAGAGGAGGDPGVGGQSAAGGAAGVGGAGAGAGGPSAGGGGAADDVTLDEGCGCRVAGRSSDRPAWALLLGLAFAAGLHRRRR